MTSVKWPESPIASIARDVDPEGFIPIPMAVKFAEQMTAASPSIRDVLQFDVRCYWDLLKRNATSANGGPVWCRFKVHVDINMSSNPTHPRWKQVVNYRHEVNTLAPFLRWILELPKDDTRREFIPDWAKTIDLADFPDEPEGVIISTLTIPIESNLVHFRIRAGVEDYLQDGSYQEDSPYWQREFRLWVNYVGDFELRYLPIGIIYCPPEQDMFQTKVESREFGTVATFANARSVSYSESQTLFEQIGGNAKINVGNKLVSGQPSFEFGESWKYSKEQTEAIQNVTKNSMSFNYRWTSTVTADNRTVVGRNYWGPLGDIFVLLKNPRFFVTGDEDGELTVHAMQTHEPELLYIPGHILLRPGDSQIVKDMTAEERREILRLNPFYSQLGAFFPEDGSEPDPDLELSHAVNPYQAPDVQLGRTTTRAVYLGKYSIGPGVGLDLTQHQGISLGELVAQSTTHATTLSETYSRSVGIGIEIIYAALSGGASASAGREQTRSLTIEVSYRDSFEATAHVIRSATCKLVRNQNQASDTDIELWWDRHFATFMFRLIRNAEPGLFGRISRGEVHIQDVEVSLMPLSSLEQLDGRAANQIQQGKQLTINKMAALQALDAIDGIQKTLTNNAGKYQFRNVPKGTYVLLVGDDWQKVDIQSDTVLDLEDVKRVINLDTARPSEIMRVFGLSEERATEVLKQAAATPPQRTITEDLAQLGLSVPEHAAGMLAGIVRSPARHPGRVTVVGWAVGPSSQPQADLEVVLTLQSRSEEKEEWATRSDYAGRFVFNATAPGTYNLKVGNKEKSVRIIKSQITQGRTIDIPLTSVKRKLDGTDEGLRSLLARLSKTPMQAEQLFGELKGLSRAGLLKGLKGQAAKDLGFAFRPEDYV